MGPTPRLVVFSVSLVALLTGAEALVRWQDDAFSAAAHRARFKAALLRRQTGLTFATIGTSRFNDGVSPAWLGRGKGFSASVPSSSLDAQRLLATAALVRPGMQALFLEASLRQVEHTGDPSLATGTQDEPRGFEESALASSRLLAHRRVLMLDNLPRLFALWAPMSFDGSEWFRTRWLLETWRAKPQTLPELPAPRVWCPGPPGETSGAHEAALVAWTSMTKNAPRLGVHVFFVVPPIAQSHRADECTEAWGALWQATATRTGVPVYDFSCAAVPDALFHDRFEHFGFEGRAAFSQALGELWTKAGREPPCGGAAP